MKCSSLLFVTGLFVTAFVCTSFPLKTAGQAEEQPSVSVILQKLEKQYKDYAFDHSYMFYTSPRVREIERYIDQYVEAGRQEEATEFLAELFKITRALDDDKGAVKK